MNLATVVVILSPPCILAVYLGCVRLKRAYSLSEPIPEEFALAFAWVFVVGSLVWLGAYLTDSTLLGFSVPWTWLAAAHFAFAGFGALTITALSCRVVSDTRMRRVLRILLVAHPTAYLVTAAGILGYPYCDELGASGYMLIFTTQLWAVSVGNPDRIEQFPRRLLTVALLIPVITLIPALSWAWGRPLVQLSNTRGSPPTLSTTSFESKLHKHGDNLTTQDLIKILATVSMMIDHVGMFFLVDDLCLRTLGRFALIPDR